MNGWLFSLFRSLNLNNLLSTMLIAAGKLKTTMKGWQKIRQSGNANYAKEPVFSPAFGQLTTKVLYMGLNGCLQDYLKS